jgi:hypothetical protein
MVYRRHYYRYESRPGEKWILLFCFVVIFIFICLCEKTGSYIKTQLFDRCEKNCMNQTICLEKCNIKYKIEKYLSNRKSIKNAKS